MSHCTSCGAEVESDDDFCRKCGNSVSDVMSDDGTVQSTNGNVSSPTVSVESETSKSHYNIENIAFLQRTDISLTVIGLLIVGLPILLGASLFIQTIELGAIGICAGALISYLLYVTLNEDGLVIGTLTSTDEYEGQESQKIANEIIETSEVPISVSGEVSTHIKNCEYEYNFFPSNIVQIREADVSNWIAVIVISLFAFFGGFLIIDFTGDVFLGQMSIIAGLLIALLLLRTGTVIRINLQSNESKEFLMSKEDAKRVVSEFTSGE